MKKNETLGAAREGKHAQISDTISRKIIVKASV